MKQLCGKHMIGKYADPSKANIATPDVTLLNQDGFTVGFDSETIKAQAFNRRRPGGGLNYSQLNYNIMSAVEAPIFFVTNSTAIPLGSQNAYLIQPDVALNSTDATEVLSDYCILKYYKIR